MTIVVTGASQGIGQALALELSRRGHSLVLVARNEAALKRNCDVIHSTGREAVYLVGDLATKRGARELGERLAASIPPNSTLVHNAGIWPTQKRITSDGLEQSFTVNHLGPWLMQAPLVSHKRLARILVIGAGLMIKGHFAGDKTPYGADFSRFRTYCTTKLCFAAAMRVFARENPDIDVAVAHPGVVQTELGASRGPIGWLLRQVKKRWESPAICASRLADLIQKDGWSARGDASWFNEATQEAWPECVDSPELERQVILATTKLARTR